MLGFIFRQFIQLFSNIGDLLEVIFRVPMQTLGLVNRDDQHSRNRGTVMKVIFGIGKLLLLPFALILNAVLLPIRAMTVFPVERRRDFLLGVPAIIALGLIGAAAIRAPLLADAINNKYRGLSQQAMQDEDFAKSQTYMARIVNSSPNPSDADLFNWAMSLLRTGDERGIAIIRRLAPDNVPGMELAHGIRAVQLSETLATNSEPNRLEQLKFHLENSQGPTSPALQLAWANYYLAIGEARKALGYIDMAAESNPQLYLVAATVAAGNNDEIGRKNALNAGAKKLEELVNDAPFDQRARTTLALVYSGQKRFEEAESVLAEGIRIKEDDFIRAAMADFLVAKFDRMKGVENFTTRLGYLEASLALNINNIKAYERLSTANQDLDASAISEVKELLTGSIADGEKPAMAHFTLSNILWQEGDIENAKWHIEEAYRVEPQFLFVANNLAWMLATSEPKDIERALELALDVVKRRPDPRFRDTLGTVYYEMGDFENARIELEQALTDGLVEISLHEKLARIYSELGKDSLAAAHVQKADEIRNAN